MERTTATYEKEVYKAKDGREYATEKECMEHEEELDANEELKKIEKKIKKLRVKYTDKELPGYIPLEQYLRCKGNKRYLLSEYARDANMLNEYFLLNSRKDARLLAQKMENENKKSYCRWRDNADEKTIMHNTGKLMYPCIAQATTGSVIHSVDEDIKLIRKYLEYHGLKMEIKRIGEE